MQIFFFLSCQALSDVSGRLSEVFVSTQRRLHLAYLLASDGSLDSTPRSYAYGKENEDGAVDPKRLSSLASHDQVYRFVGRECSVFVVFSNVPFSRMCFFFVEPFYKATILVFYQAVRETVEVVVASGCFRG